MRGRASIEADLRVSLDRLHECELKHDQEGAELERIEQDVLLDELREMVPPQGVS